MARARSRNLLPRLAARSVRVVEGLAGDRPPWAAALAHTWHGADDRQWYCVGPDDALLGGLVARWLVDRWSVKIELADGRREVATCLLQAVLKELSGLVEIGVSDDVPVVPHEALVALGFVRDRSLIAFERALPPSWGRPEPPLRLEPLTDPPSLAVLDLIEACSGLAEPGRTSWQRWKADAATAFDASTGCVAWMGGRPVGLVIPQPDPWQDHVGGMAFVGVTPQARGRGLGAQLHEVGLATLARLGVRHYFDTTEVGNVPMRRVFSRNDCIPTGRWSMWVCAS